uniref:Uncharacterized protein n=2 Tax=Clytia hemisphaerica TaxID=252671 RepID=A0A7M5XHR0_9CNID
MNKEFDCFIFTDIDLLPENDHNYYGCPRSPRHMSVAIDTFNYKLPYGIIFGGVGAWYKEDFEKINGYSMAYWGWGGEDDDLFYRVHHAKLKFNRAPVEIGRYKMVKVHHFRSSKPNPIRVELLRNSTQRMYSDGLNTLRYKLKNISELPLYTLVQIEFKKELYFKDGKYIAKVLN